MLMGVEEEIASLKKQLQDLELKFKALKNFTIEEIAKTRVNNTLLSISDKENKDRGVIQ